MSSTPSSVRRRWKPEPIETTTKHTVHVTFKGQTSVPPSLASQAELDLSTMPHDSKRHKADATHAPYQIEEEDSSNDEQVPLLPHEKLGSKPSVLQPPARRKFAPQPIETTTRSSRNTKEAASAASIKAKRDEPELASLTSRRFAAEPADALDSSSRSNRSMQSSAQESAPTRPVEAESNAPPRRRKFQVQMIETASRSRRAGDSSPAVRAEDKTNGSQSESFKISRPSPNPICPPNNTPSTSTAAIPFAQFLKPNPNRQTSIHAHYTTRANTRQHSFKVPELEAIDSSESSPNDGVSLRSRSSSISSHDEGYKDATRLRESVDDRFSGYLLALAARAAEKQLREQEAAVFPAPDAHEPVVHYVDSEESSDASPQPSQHATERARPTTARYRRDSDEEVAAIKAMRRRGEEQYASSKDKVDRKRTGGFNVEFDGEAAQEAWVSKKAQPQPGPKTKDLIGGYQRDADLRQMRKAASPPMLGGDIDFPRCPSPDHARFDVTQGSEYLRNSMSYSESQDQGDKQGLWGLAPRKPSVTSSAGNRSSGVGAGLWGGHCTSDDLKTSSVPNGIVTPARTPVLEKGDPFVMLSAGSAAGSSVAGRRPAPLTPPPSNSGTTNTGFVNVAVTQEATILEREFPDSFVTQVYNYLSLGFPALARKFDPELSKISGVDIEELRHDDKLAEQRGYIRLGEDEVDIPAPTPVPPRNTTEKDHRDGEDEGMEKADIVPVQEEMCARWRALRIYVREWGRQMGVADESGERKRLDPHRAWGMPARKGSWAG